MAPTIVISLMVAFIGIPVYPINLNPYTLDHKPLYMALEKELPVWSFGFSVAATLMSV